MLLSLATPPAGAPITLEEAKAHARVEVDDEDTLIEGYIATAVQFAEGYTNRALMPQTWDLMLDDFPHNGERWFELPKPPLQTVDLITYLDSRGDEQTWEEENYRVLAPAGARAEQGRVLLRAGKTWPVTRNEPAAVTVRFTAGYDEYEDVPAEIKTALLVHVAELYENRESTVLTGAIMQQVPFSVQNLLWPFVVGKFGI